MFSKLSFVAMMVKGCEATAATQPPVHVAYPYDAAMYGQPTCAVPPGTAETIPPIAGAPAGTGETLAPGPIIYHQPTTTEVPLAYNPDKVTALTGDEITNQITVKEPNSGSVTISSGPERSLDLKPLSASGVNLPAPTGVTNARRGSGVLPVPAPASPAMAASLEPHPTVAVPYTVMSQRSPRDRSLSTGRVTTVPNGTPFPVRRPVVVSPQRTSVTTTTVTSSTTAPKVVGPANPIRFQNTVDATGKAATIVNKLQPSPAARLTPGAAVPNTRQNTTPSRLASPANGPGGFMPPAQPSAPAGRAEPTPLEPAAPIAPLPKGSQGHRADDESEEPEESASTRKGKSSKDQEGGCWPKSAFEWAWKVVLPLALLLGGGATLIYCFCLKNEGGESESEL